MLNVPLHPAIVHVPVGLAVMMPLIAAGLAVALWRGVLPRRAWIIAVALQGMVLAGGLAAFKTGEREGDRVEKVVSHKLVHAHEERAEAFLLGAGVALLASATVLLVPAGAAAAAASIVAAGMLAVTGLAYRTGKAGGELVYVQGAANAYAASSATAAARAQPRIRSAASDGD